MDFRALRSTRTLGITAVLFGLLAATVRATPTDPFLALRSATATSGDVVVLRVEGSFHSSDLKQTPFPLQLLVRDIGSGVDYVRYDLLNGGFSGTAWTLLDGLQAFDVSGLLAAGTPDPTARVLEISEDRIDVVLPDLFTANDAEVQLFVWHEGNVVMSNPLPLPLAEVP